jgi:PAS domain S-box-containing protein
MTATPPRESLPIEVSTTSPNPAPNPADTRAPACAIEERYAIFMLDPDGLVVSWNRGAERLKGYHAEEILGQPLGRFYPPEDLAGGKPQRLLRTATELGYVEDEGWRVRKDGSRFWADAALAAIRDTSGKLLGFAKVTRDLSGRRQAEEELARSNAELESLSYSVSHDLRAPLRAIDGYARALLEDHVATLDAEGQRMLNVVRDNALHMGKLIDALLSFSRLGRQALSIKPIDMTSLAQSVLDDLRPAGRGNPSDVTLQPLPAAVGDERLIRQVLANLIGNAFKFSRTKPRPRVEISARIEGNEAVYCIEDNGTGFDMRYAAKLFHVFARLHRVEEFEGTGVGLALAQRIVQRHRGRIWAEAEVDKGATFYFTLPRPGGG